MQKPMLALISAAAFAFGANAATLPADTGTTFAGRSGTVSSATADSTESGDLSGGYFWFGSSGTVADDSEAIQNTRASQWAESAGTEYLSICTSEPLYRTAFGSETEYQDASDITPVDVVSDLYIDTQVKFTACEIAPAPSSDDKILVWLGEDGYLKVTAGYFGENGVETNTYTTTAQPTAGTWYRLTVRAVNSVTSGTTPAFMVYLNGQPLAYDSNTSLGNVTLNDFGTYARSLNNLYPSLVQTAATVKYVAYQGLGAADDILFTTTAPDFAITPVAMVNGVYYSTLEEAIAASSAEHPVELLADVGEYTVAAGTTLYVKPGSYNFTAVAGSEVAMSSTEAGGVYTYTGVAGVAACKFSASADWAWHGTFDAAYAAACNGNGHALLKVKLDSDFVPQISATYDHFHTLEFEDVRTDKTVPLTINLKNGSAYMKSSRYFFPENATLVLAADYAPWASGLVSGGTLEIPAGIEVQVGAYQALDGVSAISGSGTIVAPPDPSYFVQSAVATKSLLADSAWQGVFSISNTLASFDPAKFGNAGSTIRFDGFTAGTLGANNSTYGMAVELAGDGLTVGGDYTRNFKFTGALKGSGPLTVPAAQAKDLYVYFTGDVSGFTGDISVSSPNARVVFGDSTELNGGSITVAAGNTVTNSATSTWTAANIGVHGELVANGTMNVSGALWSNKGTGVYRANNSSAAVKVASSWNGTYVVAWSPESASDPFYINDYGKNADATIQIDGEDGVFVGYPRENNTAPSVTAKVVLNADWTTGDGYSTGVETSFASLSGPGDLTVNDKNSYQYKLVYNIAKLDGYTGTLGGRNGKFVIGAVNLSEAPAAGQVVVSTAKGAYGEFIGYPALTVADSPAGTLVWTDSAPEGYYKAVAQIGSDYYPTFAAAVAAYESGDEIVVLDASDEIPAGWELAENDTRLVESMIDFTLEVPANVVATVKANGQTIEPVNGVYSVKPGTEVTVEYAANGAYVVSNGSQTLVPAKNAVVAAPQEMTVVAAAAQIGSDYYASFAEALEAAEADDTIVLLANVALSSTVTVDKNLTIDLNGNNIAATDCRAFHVTAGAFALTGSGRVSATASAEVRAMAKPTFATSSSVVRVGSDTAATSFTLGENVTVSSDWCYGVTYFGTKKQTVVIDGTVAVTGEQAAISGNGHAKYNTADGGSDVTVNGTVTAAHDYAIYNPQTGTTVINGTVTGPGGIEVKAGSVTVNSGAVITATAQEQSHSASGNGTSTAGYAIAAVGSKSYQGEPAITVTGGTINGVAVVLADTEDVENGTITATSSDITAPADYKWVETGTAGVYELVEKVYVAKIGDQGYETFAEALEAAEAGDTITLLEDVALSSTVTVDKNLTIDLNGNDIAATDCRAFHVTAGAFALTGSGTVSATASAEVRAMAKPTFATSSSVVRVGSDTAATSFTLGENVTVSSDWCYGVTYFGTKKQTVVIDGTVAVTGEQAAISGNGLAKYNTAEGGSDVTVNGTVTAAQDYAIYNPQTGTTVINGTVTGPGGIEVKAGSVTVNSGAVITATAQEQSHSASGNGTSTAGYAIAAVGSASYQGEPSVTVTGGTIDGIAVVLADQENTGNGTITATSNEVDIPEGYRWVETETVGVYELEQIVPHLAESNLELYYNCTSQVAVVDAPAGATFYWQEEVIPGQSSGSGSGYSFSSDIKPLSVSSGRKADTVKFYSNTTNGTWHLTAYVTNDNVQVAQLVANVVVKDVAAVVNGVEYTKAQFEQAIADAIAQDEVLGIYLSAPNAVLAAGQTLKVKVLATRSVVNLPTVKGPEGTEQTVYVVNKVKDTATGVTTFSLTPEDPSVMFVSADGVTTNYFDASFKAAAAGTYKLLKNITRSQLSVGTAGVVLDLNGKTFTSTATGTTAAINVSSSTGTAGLTVVDSSDAGTGAIVAPNYSVLQSGKNGTVAVEGGSLSGKSVIVYTLSGGTAAISGGKFQMVGGSADSMLNCKDDNKGTISVTGGAFCGFDPANNTADGAGTDYVAEGYVSTADKPESGWFTVEEEVLNPVVNGVTVDTDKVFDTACTTNSIVYPGVVAVTGEPGSQTITYNNVAVEVPPYYTASLDAQTQTVTLTLNDNARTQIGDAVVGEEAKPAVEVGAENVGVTITSSNAKLYYGLLTSTTPGGDYTLSAPFVQGTGSAMQLSVPKDGAVRFYKLYVNDVPAVN